MFPGLRPRKNISERHHTNVSVNLHTTSAFIHHNYVCETNDDVLLTWGRAEDASLVEREGGREGTVAITNRYIHSFHDVNEATVIAMETVDGDRNLVTGSRQEGHVTGVGDVEEVEFEAGEVLRADDVRAPRILRTRLSKFSSWKVAAVVDVQAFNHSCIITRICNTYQTHRLKKNT